MTIRPSYIFFSPIFAILFLSGCIRSDDPSRNKAHLSADLFVHRVPLLVGKKSIHLADLVIGPGKVGDTSRLEKVTLYLAPGSPTVSHASADFVTAGISDTVIFSGEFRGQKIIFRPDVPIADDTVRCMLSFTINPGVNLLDRYEVSTLELSFINRKYITLEPAGNRKIYPGLVLRAKGQEGVHTYRIPGLATSNKGTLIAVYDIRYDSDRDLQGDIDVGMSRSIDGGQTWEPMKVIMNMKEYGGRPETENGIGDPSVLVDRNTGTIWVAGLWFHGHPGETAWNGSGKGLTAKETGQFMLVKSDDDGQTWSAPVNITKQVKDPDWRLMFQGPGKGITMEDGTLVFPAQYKDADNIPYSTIIFSTDHGASWKCGTGAKSHTTEAQVVQLSDGSLMLNMRDDRNRNEKGDNNGRAVAVSTDMGANWRLHPTSNKTLPEPTCMASLIATELEVKGKMQQVLFFSNPADTHRRHKMTIKMSLDQGNSWPDSLYFEINRAPGYGYSCMTRINEETIGILYEGFREIYFQAFQIEQLLAH